MYKSDDGWKRAYIELGAYWEHDGNPRRPHALLTSGEHSNGFFNSKLVAADDTLLCQAAVDLADHLESAGFNPVGRGIVVGPATGATKLASALSRILHTRGRAWGWASPVKVDEGPNKIFLWDKSHQKVSRGDRVLLVEDVISTGGSVGHASRLVSDAGGVLFPYIGALVNRSGLSEIDGRKIISLISRPMPMWKPIECPLCKAGSLAIRPKENNGENWELLTAKY